MKLDKSDKWGIVSLSGVLIGVVALIVVPEIRGFIIPLSKNPVVIILILTIFLFLAAIVCFKKSYASKILKAVETIQHIQHHREKFEKFYKNKHYVDAFKHLNTSHYAATVFMIRERDTKESAEMLFVRDHGDEMKKNKNIKPLGMRMHRNAKPEEFIQQMVEKNTGYKKNDYGYSIFADQKIDLCSLNYDNTEVMKTPIVMQLESNPQRDDISYHVDFIYLLTIKNGKTRELSRRGLLDPDWYPITYIEEEFIGKNRFTFPNTKALTKIIIEKHKSNQIEDQ